MSVASCCTVGPSSAANALVAWEPSITDWHAAAGTFAMDWLSWSNPLFFNLILTLTLIHLTQK